jgi:crossover junction endodeoxyribonuclease RuvC
MNRVLGIDPGSNITGYGLVESDGSRSRYIICGAIRTPSGKPMAERLKTIFESTKALITEYRPDEVAIEQVFMHRNADAALKLGQARGAAICAAATSDLVVNEYAPRAVKLAVVGHGGAAKEQVQHMVCALLNLTERPQVDAADALAIALCHIHTRQTFRRTGLTLEAIGRRR